MAQQSDSHEVLGGTMRWIGSDGRTTATVAPAAFERLPGRHPSFDVVQASAAAKSEQLLDLFGSGRERWGSHPCQRLLRGEVYALA